MFNVSLTLRTRWDIDLTISNELFSILTTKNFEPCKSRKENPQKLTQLISRSHPRHLVGKKAAQKDTIIDITSDSQVNSNFPYRWSPTSLTFYDYFYLFLYLYITGITINNNASKITKEPKQMSRFGTASKKNDWGASTRVRSNNPRP